MTDILITVAILAFVINVARLLVRVVDNLHVTSYERAQIRKRADGFKWNGDPSQE